MKISQMIKQLQEIIDSKGDLGVVQQSDAEGNSYDWCRGAEIGYLTTDMEYCYDSEESAQEDFPDDFEEVVVIYP